MTLSPRLELRQSQTLVMTPRLQQAIRMLRMSNLELSEHVTDLVQANPLLEMRPPLRDAGFRGLGTPVERANAADAVDLAVSPVSLREHLRTHLRLMRTDPVTLAAATAIVEELEPDGYLRTPLEELSSRYRLPAEAVAAGLVLVQKQEPAGVGARTLAECFRLQLADLGILDTKMAALLNHLELLAEGRSRELAERCGLAPEALSKCLKVLQRLDPKPGLAFTVDAMTVVVPDIFVRRTESGWEVEVNSETLPRVLVNNMYTAKIRTQDKETRRYIAECQVQATWLIRSLEQRAHTIIGVASALVVHQELFFAKGVSALKPLSRRLLAEKIGMHESTVSRVAASKYLSCDRGTFSLRSFFSQALPSRQGGDFVSAAAVQERIRMLLGTENAARPLSDDRLVTVLSREGIDIARRTVAKYREGMGIPSSFERRRKKTPGGCRS